MALQTVFKTAESRSRFFFIPDSLFLYIFIALGLTAFEVCSLLKLAKGKDGFISLGTNAKFSLRQIATFVSCAKNPRYGC